MKRFFSIHLLLLSVTLGHISCAHAQRAKVKEVAIPENFNIHAASKEHLLVSDQNERLLLLSLKNFTEAIQIDESPKKLSQVEFASDASVFFVVSNEDRDNFSLRLYSTSTGKALSENKGLKKLKTAFWMDQCRFAALTAPLKNGGNLKIMRRLDRKECVESKLSSSPASTEVSTKSFWTDSNFNSFAYLENGGRELLSWIGEGTFYDFQAGPAPYLWFREDKTPQVVIRGDRKDKTVQPVGQYETFLAHPTKPEIIGYRDNFLYLSSLNSKGEPKEKELYRGKVEAIRWLDTGKTLLLEAPQGKKMILEL